MDSKQELQIKDYLFDEFEYDEDVFYCELKKQVLQLTAEDDDEEMVEARKQGLDNGPSGVSRDRVYYNWPVNKDSAAPAWMMNLWRTGNGNGTGVFIPQIVQTKKKNRSRRRKNERERRTYMRVEKV